MVVMGVVTASILSKGVACTTRDSLSGVIIVSFDALERK
jgi:hypothetical protein